MLDRALTLLNAALEKERFATLSGKKSVTAGKGGATAKAPREQASRHIPNDVKRQVVARDGMRCAFVGTNGHRCESTRQLEYHHLDPWAKTRKHSADKIEMRCRTHNLHAGYLPACGHAQAQRAGVARHAARRDFGADVIEERIRRRQAESRKATTQAPLF